jgi:hypothetical protein
MPAGTKVAKAEKALKASAAKAGMKGERADRYVFGALNNLGLKSGSKSTKKGLAKASKR